MNNKCVGFWLTNVDKYIIRVGFELTNIDTIRILIRHEHDLVTRIVTLWHVIPIITSLEMRENTKTIKKREIKFY